MLTPTKKVALALFVVAVGGLVAWFADKGLRPWAPNITVGALTVAITITLVESAIRREQERRIRPHVEDVVYWMGLDFRGMLSALATDYAATHLESFKPIPEKAMDLIDAWLSEQDAEDNGRRPRAPGELPMLIASGREFANHLDLRRDRDREVMEPDLVRAIDDVEWYVSKGQQLIGLVDEGLSQDDPTGTEGVGLASTVEGVRKFAEVFGKYGPDWMEMPRITREGSAAHRDRLRWLRDQPPSK